MDFHHESVLLDEVIEFFAASKPSVLVDCTLGGAGHSRALLEAIDGLHLIGIDRDPTAIAIATERLASFGQRVRIVQAPFSEVNSVLEELGVAGVDGILADFGVSSHRLTRLVEVFPSVTMVPWTCE
jgi:16S rRNA (cytosine1402-N4)-methyltransferase